MWLNPRRAFSVIEALIAMAVFSLLTTLLAFTLQATSQVWRRTSARDLAMRQLLRARNYLTRDLVNASQVPGQWATGSVGPSLGAGTDGDALSVLTCDNGSAPWSVASNGASVLTGEVTYSLFVPLNVNNLFGYSFPGVADAAGYEEGCPYKFLVRRRDPLPAGSPPKVPANWTTTLLARPGSYTATANSEVVATLTGFRVLQSGALWQFELKATAVEDARRKISIGTTPLGSSPYTIVQRFSLPAHN